MERNVAALSSQHSDIWMASPPYHPPPGPHLPDLLLYHLLPATHDNIRSGILVGAIIAVLNALLVLGYCASQGGMDVDSLPFLSEEG